jgi:hypothetical protein
VTGRDPTPPLSEAFTRLTERLCQASVQRRWEAYRDIGWDDPALAVHADDPRWELPAWDPVGASEWYRDQAAEQRFAIGLFRVAALYKVGIEFEAILGQGLLRYAATLPNGHPAFRYIQHEVSEEAQHSMMFQEFINRSGADVPCSSEEVQERYRRFANLGERSVGGLFLAVLVGEEAFDHIQRRLVEGDSVHPLVRRTVHIHVAEEARHLSFARAFLRDLIPRLPARDAQMLRYMAPSMLAGMTTHVFGPENVLHQLGERWDLPEDVRRTIREGRPADALRRGCMQRVVRLCEELDLVDPRLEGQWSALVTAGGPPA